MLRPILAALVTGATLLGATAAQAETRWSIGINLPPAHVVVSDGPRYYAPAPVYYTPAPRYVHRDVYYAPPRVVYETRHHHHHHRWHDRHDRHDHRDWRRDHDRHDRWDRGHDGHGPHRGR
jgi:hypothetical protein